jgi:hypothetical protein
MMEAASRSVRLSSTLAVENHAHVDATAVDREINIMLAWSVDSSERRNRWTPDVREQFRRSGRKGIVRQQRIVVLDPDTARACSQYCESNLPVLRELVSQIRRES